MPHVNTTCTRCVQHPTRRCAVLFCSTQFTRAHATEHGPVPHRTAQPLVSHVVGKRAMQHKKAHVGARRESAWVLYVLRTCCSTGQPVATKVSAAGGRRRARAAGAFVAARGRPRKEVREGAAHPAGPRIPEIESCQSSADSLSAQTKPPLTNAADGLGADRSHRILPADLSLRVAFVGFRWHSLDSVRLRRFTLSRRTPTLWSRCV